MNFNLFGRRQTMPMFARRLTKIKVQTSKYEQSFNVNRYTSNILQELKPAPPVDTNAPNFRWPSELTPIFAISMRADRYQNLLFRMQRWSSLVQLIPATQGTKIDLGKWKNMNRLNTNADISRGQIGCYESHVRVWQKIQTEGIPHALVLEDDADISYSQNTVDKLREFLSELKTISNWDIVYIGSIGLHPVKQKVTEHLNEPSNWEGLYTYYLTYEGARKLLRNAFPIEKAVDIYVGDQARQGNIRSLVMWPPLNYVVPVKSDTNVKT